MRCEERIGGFRRFLWPDKTGWRQSLRCLGRLLRVGSLDQLAHALFAQRLAYFFAIQQVNHDLPECGDFRQGRQTLR